jgi:YD repeat-containing protein
VGRIRDSGVAGDLEGPLSVALGATAAELVNGSFQVDATLATGFNTLRLIAADARGKTTVRDYKVVRGGSAGPTLSVISGDAAAVTAGQPGSVQLIVEARDAAGAVEKSVPVEFRVALGDGRLDGGARSRTLLTAASGRAAVLFTPGTQAGAALVLATAPDRVNSPAGFSASVSPSASRILVAHGKRQLAGIAGLDAATSPSVRLLDEFGNPVLGESVTFRVVDGGARFSGSVQVQAVTGLQGVAAAALRLPASIESRSVVEVSHAAAPATVVFEALGGALGPPADTSVAGSVLDERGIPVAGAIVKLRTGAGDLSTTADSVGGFEIPGAPGGAAVLFPEEPAHEGISSRTFLIPGRRNLLDAPLRLMRTASDLRHRSELVGESQGALLTLPSLPGLRCSVAPGAARFPDGTAVRPASPSPRSVGARSPARFPTICSRRCPSCFLPEGVRFDPPAALCLPAARDRSGRTVPLFAHRPAAGGFVELPGGIVDDAEIVSTTSSHGVRSSGVHFFSQAGPPAGRVGSLFGEVSAPIPGLSDAPQRPESLVLGINVYAHSGELFVDEVDLELPSPGRGMPYRFRRRYESRHNFQGALGRNWEHDYEDRRVAPAPDGGNVLRADGAGGFVEYLLDASTGAWVSPPGVFARLTSAADGSIVEREPDGTSYHYHALDAGRWPAGSRRSPTEPALACRFIHGAEGRLLQAVDALGRFVAYEHDGAGRITRVTDFTGRVVSFEYDGAGDLVAVTRPAVVLSPPGNDFPDGKRREYVYSAGFTDVRLLHNLVQIIDPREVAGARAPRLTVEYGTDPLQPSFDRVTGEVWGGTNATGIPAGGNLHFEYSTWTRPARRLGWGPGAGSLSRRLGRANALHGRGRPPARDHLERRGPAALIAHFHRGRRPLAARPGPAPPARRNHPAVLRDPVDLDARRTSRRAGGAPRRPNAVFLRRGRARSARAGGARAARGLSGASRERRRLEARGHDVGARAALRRRRRRSPAGRQRLRPAGRCPMAYAPHPRLSGRSRLRRPRGGHGHSTSEPDRSTRARWRLARLGRRERRRRYVAALRQTWCGRRRRPPRRPMEGASIGGSTTRAVQTVSAS